MRGPTRFRVGPHNHPAFRLEMRSGTSLIVKGSLAVALTCRERRLRRCESCNDNPER